MNDAQLHDNSSAAKGKEEEQVAQRSTSRAAVVDAGNVALRFISGRGAGGYCVDDCDLVVAVSLQAVSYSEARVEPGLPEAALGGGVYTFGFGECHGWRC